MYNTTCFDNLVSDYLVVLGESETNSLFLKSVLADKRNAIVEPVEASTQTDYYNEVPADGTSNGRNVFFFDSYESNEENTTFEKTIRNEPSVVVVDGLQEFNLNEKYITEAYEASEELLIKDLVTMDEYWSRFQLFLKFVVR